MISEVGLAGYSNYSKKVDKELNQFNNPKTAKLSAKSSFVVHTPTPKTVPNLAYITTNFTYHDKAMWLYMEHKISETQVYYSTTREHDFDVIAQPKNFNFFLRNADIKDITLDSIEVVSLTGIEILGLSEGDKFTPSFYKRVTIVGSQVGDMELNGVINFRFNSGQIITLAIRGQRAIIFSYRPNYPYSESKELKTNVFISQNGNENRSPVREVAIRSVSFSLTTKEIDSGVEPLLSYAMKSYLMVPLWFSATPLNMDGNFDNLACDTKFKEFKANEFVVVWRDSFTFEFAKVIGFDEKSIKLNKKVDIKKGDFIIPLMKVTPSTKHSYTFQSDQVKQISLEFKELL